MPAHPPREASAPADPAVAFLRAVLPPHLLDTLTPPPSPVETHRPFVTLTYAQSLDGKIAGPAGKQLILSGEHSMRLTHRLRELHDSILVGVGTLLNDDPQLTARLPHLLPLSSQPRPIVLDSTLRTPPTCKLLLNAQHGIGHAPTLVHRPLDSLDGAARARAATLEQAGAKLLPLEPDANGFLPLSSLLSHPHAPQILGRSLMVEGGAGVIASSLAAPPPGVVDLLVVTVAPVLVGPEGVSAAREGVKLSQLEHIKTEVFGRDTVFACRPVYDAEGEA
ncbi:2,5-diamino-6-(ribosylamino)-4(3H)-pyrimidinone 5'-phosphate reductase [Rhodotorula kratochvilovae]